MKTIETPKKEKKPGRIARWSADCRKEWDKTVRAFRSAKYLVEIISLGISVMFNLGVITGKLDPKTMSTWSHYTVTGAAAIVLTRALIELHKYFVNRTN